MLHHSQSMSINMSDPTQIKSEGGVEGRDYTPHTSYQLTEGGGTVWNLLATAWNPRRFPT